jgi:hypothetical protein
MKWYYHFPSSYARRRAKRKQNHGFRPFGLVNVVNRADIRSELDDTVRGSDAMPSGGHMLYGRCQVLNAHALDLALLNGLMANGMKKLSKRSQKVQ